MNSSLHSPLHGEIGAVAFFISLPQLIMSPVAVGISHLLHAPNSVPFDVIEILDFLLISFPLTLSIAMLFVIIEKGEFNLFILLAVVAGAALLSNGLHLLLSKIPSIDIRSTFNKSFDPRNNKGGISAVTDFVLKVFRIYWDRFGAILFIQSCCIGIYGGYKYLKIEKARKEEETKKQAQTKL